MPAMKLMNMPYSLLRQGGKYQCVLRMGVVCVVRVRVYTALLKHYCYRAGDEGPRIPDAKHHPSRLIPKRKVMTMAVAQCRR